MIDEYWYVRFNSKEYLGVLFWLFLPALVLLSLIVAVILRSYYLCKLIGSRRNYKRLTHWSRKGERCFDAWCSKLFGEQK